MFNREQTQRFIDYDPYQAMDLRHIELLYECLIATCPIHAVEVGCCFGASTTAFVQAAEARPGMQVDVIDPSPDHSAINLVRDASDRGLMIRLFRKKSETVLPGLRSADFVFLDGDNSVEAFERESAILGEAIPRVVCIHDSSAFAAGYECCPGPQLMKRWLYSQGWYCLEDSLKRPGERTERGFLVACRSEYDYQRALLPYRRVCG